MKNDPTRCLFIPAFLLLRMKGLTFADAGHRPDEAGEGAGLLSGLQRGRAEVNNRLARVIGTLPRGNLQHQRTGRAAPALLEMGRIKQGKAEKRRGGPWRDKSKISHNYINRNDYNLSGILVGTSKN